MSCSLTPLRAVAFALAFVNGAHAGPPRFADLSPSHWAAPSIADVTEAGILEGYGGKFHGEELVNRYQMAVIMKRLLDEQTRRAADIARGAAEAVVPDPILAAATQTLPVVVTPSADVESLRRDLAATKRELAVQRLELAKVSRFLRPSRFKPW